MRHGLSFYIGLRYTRAKRRQGFVSFISLVSILGIALGVAVLITILSVFNGFNSTIRQQFFSMASEVNLFYPKGAKLDENQIKSQAIQLPQIIASAPTLSGQGMLSANGQMQPTLVLGIDPRQETKLSDLSKNITSGKLSSLVPRQFNMVIGRGLAKLLGIGVGDKLTLLTPQASLTPVGIMPRYKRFLITGVFKASPGFAFDSSFVFINIKDAKALFAGGQYNYGLHFKLRDPYQAVGVSEQLQALFPPPFQVTNWSDSYGAFFKALSMEKTMMLVILTLIIAVATFNLVSSLMMTVNDKRADIAILRTLGATPGLITRTFLVQGITIGMIGCALGVIGGVGLALNISAFVNWLQQVLHIQLVSSAMFFVDYLPSKLQWADVFDVIIIAMTLSVVATIYPAWSAGRTQPAEALRYE